MKRRLDTRASPSALDTVDRRIRTIAERHLGLVTRTLMRAADISNGSIWRRVRSGLLIPMYPNVFAFGQIPQTREGIWMAQILAAGPGALLTGLPSARLWDLSRWYDDEAEIIVPRRVDPIEEAIIRYSGTIVPADRAVRSSVPTTSVERLIVELAIGQMIPHQLCWVCREAQFHGRFDLGRLVECIDRNRCHPAGAYTVLRRMLTLLESGTRGTRSGLEDRALPRLTELLGEEPVVNTLLHTGMGAQEPDFRVNQLRLIYELDGEAGHGRTAERAYDPAQDDQYRRSGWTVERIPGWMVDADDGSFEHAVVAARDRAIRAHV